MSRNEARGHNYKAPLAAPPHVERADRVVCAGCRSTMQVVVDPATGKPFERCFSCGPKPAASRRGRKR